MVEISEIKDNGSLREWLEQRPPSDAIAIASRCALRVLPVFWSWTLANKARREKLDALPILRSVLHVALAAHAGRSKVDLVYADFFELDIQEYRAQSTPQVAASLESAHRALAALDSATVSKVAAMAAAAAKFYAVAASSTVFEQGAIWGNVRQDCSDLMAGNSLRNVRLWRGEGLHEKLWADLRARILSAENWQPGDWQFWVEWYERMLDPVSCPPNWELIEEVVLIEPEVWEAGPRKVSKEIDLLTGGRNHGGSVDGMANDLKIQNKFPNRISENDLAITKLEARLPPVRTSIQSLEAAQIDLAAGFRDLQKQSVEQFESLRSEYEEKFKSSLEAFQEKHVFEAPVELWRAKQEEHEQRRDSAWGRYQTGLGIIVVLLVAFGVLMFLWQDFANLLFSADCDLKSAPEKCTGIGPRGAMLIVSMLTILTLAFWFTRIEMRQFLSERHLALDARERQAFAQTYLGFLEKGDGVSEDVKEQRAIVYAALFRPSSDGIVKDEGGLDPSLAAALSKFLSKS